MSYFCASLDNLWRKIQYWRTGNPEPKVSVNLFAFLFKPFEKFDKIVHPVESQMSILKEDPSTFDQILSDQPVSYLPLSLSQT
jgi:hypothetical protein